MSIIRILPADVQAVMKNPKGMEKAFMGYLKEKGLVFSTSKTFAGVCRFDKRIADGVQTEIEFFNGTSTFPFQTNIQTGIKPDSEHDMYYCLRIKSGVAEQPGNSNTAVLLPGFSAAAVLRNGLLNVSVNGEVQMNNYPLNEALGVSDGMSEMESGFIFLPVAICWPGQTSVKISMRFPSAVPQNTVIELDLFGVGMIS
jgi:hypothetical protein